jgi:hypothetical protein
MAQSPEPTAGNGILANTEASHFDRLPGLLSEARGRQLSAIHTLAVAKVRANRAHGEWDSAAQKRHEAQLALEAADREVLLLALELANGRF